MGELAGGTKGKTEGGNVKGIHGGNLPPKHSWLVLFSHISYTSKKMLGLEMQLNDKALGEYPALQKRLGSWGSVTRRPSCN